MMNDLNNRLAQITENPSRENILNLSFALLQWMGIAPNKDSKPQLLSPQTQKLKDFLAPAPQTVQPQLYRLSADNQNIHVRFAVLKKLKKDYIGQLVDNDPGLSSYQSFIKGITAQNGSSFVPSQPYFIHFVTTPGYDKLVLVLNKAEQKRIVAFRRKLTATQYHKILQQWQGIGTKPKPEIADLLWKSLDIKEVNKEFYKQIKERFDALLGIVKTQPVLATDNQVKQFTVRLIGRYIFCWFLKEKGIIPPGLMGTENIRNTPNYYQTVLLPLFFKTLNTKVQDRETLPAPHPGTDRVPYLNGGLFDESEEDKLFAHVNLDAWLLPFVEILESYDFTVDESSSQYQQVAVDPEMLGRIFENLLASQNEETEKLANQRKAFGAFYTPREIVDYMVDESLKAYLQTQWEEHKTNDSHIIQNSKGIEEDLFGLTPHKQIGLALERPPLSPHIKSDIENRIAPLFQANPSASHLPPKDKSLLLGFLEKIKILDPACGSGAFPMGILHKLVELHETLGTVKNPYELKKDILSQNIYGVDIMPMAIEIARLRAWLSLVLEENYNPKDPVHNFGVKPLPNLDFKFVCANSLIDLGLDAFIKNSKGTLHEGFTQKLVRQLKQLEDLRKQFFTPALGSTEKEQLKADYFDERDKVIAAIEAAYEPVLKTIAQKIKHWNPFDDSQPSPFFSPTWMFGIDKGFDVVIGNPPYVQMQKNNGFLAEQLKGAGYSTFERTGDIYALFYELGFNVLSNKGVHTFITSSQWLKAAYGKSLRKLFISKNPIKLIALGPGVFESAVVDTNILIAKNALNENKLVGSIVDKPEQLAHLNDLKYHPMPYVTVERWAIMDDGKKSISGKLMTKGKPLKEWNIKINFGIKTGYNEAFIIDRAKRNELVEADAKNSKVIKPILKGREISKYLSECDNDYIIYIPWHFPLDDDGSIVGASEKAEKEFSNHYKTLYDYMSSHKQALSERNKAETGIRYEWYALQRCAATYSKEFSKAKIIWKNIGSQVRFSYSDDEIYGLDTTCIATGEKIKYLTALLNSKLCIYQLMESAPRTGMGDLKTSVQAIEPLLIYYPTEKEQQQIEQLVDEILKKKKSKQDTTALEREIDVLVYKLYELTYAEVKIIDKDFWLSEAEYDSVKIG